MVPSLVLLFFTPVISLINQRKSSTFHGRVISSFISIDIMSYGAIFGEDQQLQRGRLQICDAGVHQNISGDNGNIYGESRRLILS
jgi:hypothetical protein